MDKHIENLFNVIEDNLYRDFNIENIANAGYVSSMQLYRDFYNLTGHTVKEYVRKRRLSCALSLVAHSDLSLVDIAYKCGYGSQQAFCKSVKSVTGQSPLEYKANDGYFYFPALNKGRNKHQVTVATETIPQMIKLKYYHTCLIGIENCAVDYLVSVTPEYKGRIFGCNGEQVGNRFCYELYIESDGDIPKTLINSDFKSCEIISEYKCVFAKTGCRNDEEEINTAWDYIYTVWLKASMFEQGSKPYFEEYIMKDGIIKKLILYLPVRKRKEYHKIRIKKCEEGVFLVCRKKGKNAEDNASQTVMGYLRSCYPYIIRNDMKFIVAVNGFEHICGVNIDKPLPLPVKSELEILKMDAGNYAILEGDCCGNNAVYENTLRSWAEDKSLKTESQGVCFAVYETNGSLQEEDVKVKIYLKLEKC